MCSEQTGGGPMTAERISKALDRDHLMTLRKREKDHVTRALLSRRISELTRTTWMPGSLPAYLRLEAQMRTTPVPLCSERDLFTSGSKKSPRPHRGSALFDQLPAQRYLRKLGKQQPGKWSSFGKETAWLKTKYGGEWL